MASVRIQKKDGPENPKTRLILDAARKMFCEKGYDTTSTDLVAQTAGVSKATLYAHFKSKEVLLLAVVEDETRRFAPESMWDPSEGTLDVPATLGRIAERQMAFFLSRRDCTMRHMIEALLPRFPEIGRRFWAAGPGKALAEVAAFLRAAAAEGKLDVPDPELAASQFLCLVRGDVPILRMLMPDLPVRDRMLTQIDGAIRLFLTAYGRRSHSARK